jgi:hypothetical protein
LELDRSLNSFVVPWVKTSLVQELTKVTSKSRIAVILIRAEKDAGGFMVVVFVFVIEHKARKAISTKTDSLRSKTANSGNWIQVAQFLAARHTQKI